MAFLFPAMKKHLKNRLSLKRKSWILVVALETGVTNQLRVGSKVLMGLTYKKIWYNWPNKLLLSSVQSIYVLEM